MSEQWKRATTAERKREVVERLLAAWERCPHQRLGQVLVNAANQEALAGAVSLFNIEDEAIVAMVERFADPRTVMT